MDLAEIRSPKPISAASAGRVRDSKEEITPTTSTTTAGPAANSLDRRRTPVVFFFSSSSASFISHPSWQKLRARVQEVAASARWKLKHGSKIGSTRETFRRARPRNLYLIPSETISEGRCALECNGKFLDKNSHDRDPVTKLEERDDERQPRGGFSAKNKSASRWKIRCARQAERGGSSSLGSARRPINEADIFPARRKNGTSRD